MSILTDILSKQTDFIFGKKDGFSCSTDFNDSYILNATVTTGEILNVKKFFPLVSGTIDEIEIVFSDVGNNLTFSIVDDGDNVIATSEKSTSMGLSRFLHDVTIAKNKRYKIMVNNGLNKNITVEKIKFKSVVSSKNSNFIIL